MPEDLRHRVDDLEVELSGIKKDYAAKEEEAQKWKGQWSDMQEYLESEPSGGMNTIAQVTALKNELSGVKSQIEMSERTLQEKTDEAERHVAHIAKLDSHIEEKDKINVEYQGMVEDLQKQQESDRNRIEELERALQAKDDEIAAITLRHQQQINLLNESQAEQDKVHAAVIVEKNMDIELKSGIIAEKAEMIKNLEEVVSDLQKTVESKSNDISVLQVEKNRN